MGLPRRRCRHQIHHPWPAAPHLTAAVGLRAACRRRGSSVGSLVCRAVLGLHECQTRVRVIPLYTMPLLASLLFCMLHLSPPFTATAAAAPCLLIHPPTPPPRCCCVRHLIFCTLRARPCPPALGHFSCSPNHSLAAPAATSCIVGKRVLPAAVAPAAATRRCAFPRSRGWRGDPCTTCRLFSLRQPTDRPPSYSFLPSCLSTFNELYNVASASCVRGQQQTPIINDQRRRGRLATQRGGSKRAHGRCNIQTSTNKDTHPTTRGR